MKQVKQIIILLIIAFTLSGYASAQARRGRPSQPSHATPSRPSHNDRYRIPCRNCEWMAKSMHLTEPHAVAYYKIIHRYAERIEKEVFKADPRHINRVNKRIANLRIERDQRVKAILTPPQFRSYIRYIKERPQRIHDQHEWFDHHGHCPYSRHSSRWDDDWHED